MNDLIARQAAINAMCELMHHWFGVDTKDEVREINQELGKLPTAQKKGHWIDEGTNYCCSECHRGCWVKSNYCPWCGAEMREETEDDEIC